MPVMANLASNLTLPKGLQTTIHLSQEMMAKDQRPVIPLGQSRHRRALSQHFARSRGRTPPSPPHLPAKPDSPKSVFGSMEQVSWSISFSNTCVPCSFPDVHAAASLCPLWFSLMAHLASHLSFIWPPAFLVILSMQVLMATYTPEATLRCHRPSQGQETGRVR